MDHSLINPNQARAFKIPFHDNNFDAIVFGTEADGALIPFTSNGKVISFELQVPTEWEQHNLPVIFLIGDQWDPINVELGSRKMQQAEPRNIKYLTYGTRQRDIADMRKGQGKYYG